MIKLTNINKYYRQGDHRFHVLHDINLSVDQGELVAIIGESGSGKSTLINIIGFLDDDFSGTYFYEDHPIHDYTRKQFSHLRNQNVGFVFQNFKLIREATVAENVALPLLYAGKRRREIGDRVTARPGWSAWLRGPAASEHVWGPTTAGLNRPGDCRPSSLLDRG